MGVIQNLVHVTLDPVLKSFGNLSELLEDLDLEEGIIKPDNNEKSAEVRWAELTIESPLPTDEEVRECFDQIDSDSDGKLTFAELLMALQKNRTFLHLMLPNLGAKAMMSEIGLRMSGDPLMAGLDHAGRGATGVTDFDFN